MLVLLKVNSQITVQNYNYTYQAKHFIIFNQFSYYQLMETTYAYNQQDIQLMYDNIDIQIEKLLTQFSNKHCPTKKELTTLLKQCAKMGYITLHIATAKHGLGMPSKLQWHIIRKLSQYNPGIALSYLAHSILITQTIITHNTHPSNNTIINKLCGGEYIGCCAISEPNAGSDVMSMRTYAKRHKNGYSIQGEKCWITNAPYADYALVYAKIADVNSKELGVFLVDCNQNTVEKSKPIEKIGMLSSPTGSIYFNNSFVHSTQRIDNNNAKKILFEQLHFERLMLSAGPIGIMDYCYYKAVSYSKVRRQFNKPICEHGQVQALLANMWVKYQASIALCEKALKLEHQHKIDPEWASGCYLHAAESALIICDSAIQCLGGNGYTSGEKLGQYSQDAKLYTIGGGTSEIRRGIISKAITK